MLHTLLHGWISTWFYWVENWGYWGVFLLMAMESSILPVPSEIVMPPAAFWAAQGRMDFFGVILMGTLGSYFGSAVTYWAAYGLGRPFVHRFGKFVFLPGAKMEMAELWVKQYGMGGVFFARLLPVIRHLISIPAGLFKMPFLRFSVVTFIGAGIWCMVLAWFGREIIGDRPELLQSPEMMSVVIKSKLKLLILAIGVLACLYGAMLKMRRRHQLLIT